MDASIQPPEASEAALMEAEERVLSDLGQAKAHLRDLREGTRRQATALQNREAEVTRLQSQVAHLEEQKQNLAQRLQDSERQSEQERDVAQAERDRRAAEQAHARQLEEVLRELHRTFFSGNVYSLILKACLTLTGATRGLYVTAQAAGAPLRIRAAVDVDSYPQSPPSAFLQEACRHVLQSRETLVANSPEPLTQFPTPEAETERFRNCIITPVSLMQSLSGIVIAADKSDGDFSDEDVRSILAVGNQAGIVAENSRLRRQLQQAYLATVSVMADAMEAKDSYTQGHSEAVSRYARLIARHLNLSDLERSVVSYAALLHDIGKIGVSDGLLNKPGPLTPEERDLVRTHVRLGHDLIKHVPALLPVAEAVLHHHECFDGTGYPDGLAGDAIPVASRIVCVVDAYSAMITRRSYKEAYSEDWARAELRRCAGEQFDPKIVDTFLYVLDMPDLDALEEDDEELEWLPVFHIAPGVDERILLPN